jgi:hypothetical protein
MYLTDAFNPDALRKRVSGVASQAGAHRPDASMDAVSPHSAGMRSTSHRVVGDGTAMLVQVTSVVGVPWVVVVVTNLG